MGSSHCWEDDSATYYSILSSHPLWWTKPGSGDGKRRKRKPLGSSVAPGVAPSAIMKTFEDPGNVLGKRRKDRLLAKCADTFVPGVYYSMEKRDRWAEANPEDLLNGVEADDVSVQVVVAKTPFPDNYYKNRTVVAVHELDRTGKMVSKTAGGQGTSLSCLTSVPKEEQRRNRRTRRVLAKEQEENADAKENIPRTAQIRYTIMHEKPNYYGRYIRGRTPSWDVYLDRSRGHVKRDRLREVEHSEPEDTVESEGEGCQPRRGTKFSLGDFMSKKVQELPKRRRKKISMGFEKIDLPERDEAKPFGLVDSTSVPGGTFEFVNVDTSNWTNFDIEQVEALSTKGYEVRWLDKNSQRVLVDATNVADKCFSYTREPTVVVVIERCWGENRTFLRVHLNTTIPAEKGFNWREYKKHLIKCDVSNVESLVASTVRLPQRWKALAGKFVDKSLKPATGKEHHPRFSVKEFLGSAHRITYQQMVNMLRSECVQVDDDSFEDLGQPPPGELPSIPSGAKCGSCGSDRINKLYEMDDRWLCRQCVYQSAIHQIRVDCTPIDLPFVIPADITSYDVLPSVLPLPLFNFYTKYAAVKLIKEAFGNIDLRECPGCEQTVEIIRPNEYNCVQCECGIVWCIDCKKEPHWPLTCEMVAEWRWRWKHRRLGDDRRSQRLRQVTCQCLGPPIVFDESEEYAECENCKIAFNPQTMDFRSYRGRPYLRCLQLKAVEDTILPKVHVPRINKEVIEVCEKARDSRYAVGNTNQLDKACRSLKGGNVGNYYVGIIALYIIEYGTAWVHMQKSLVDRAELKGHLSHLIRQHDDLVHAIEYQRPNVAESLQAVKVLVRKTIDLIKKNL